MSALIDEDDKIVAAITEAELKAWKALARYKFLMFGYHAAQWVLLNRISINNKQNPFRALVTIARDELHCRPEPEPRTAGEA